jgi:hypothetical protein
MKSPLVLALLTVPVPFTICGQAPYGDVNRKADVSHARLLGITPALATMDYPVEGIRSSVMKQERENFGGRVAAQAGMTPAHHDDPVWQRSQAGQRGGLGFTIHENFDGTSEQESGIYPADPTGDVGTQHYIQMVNTMDQIGNYGSLIKVFDKSGNQLGGSIYSSSLWTSLGEIGTGDPVVTYDQDADRWILLEMCSDFASLLIAVSTTADPLGTWYAYKLTAPDLPDYPKTAIWPNGYIITTDEGFNGGESPVYAFDRADMLNGAPQATVVRFGVPGIAAITVQMINGVDWEGSALPVDADPMILRLQDDAWGVVGQDQIEMWNLHLDWVDTTNAQLVGPVPVYIASFDASVCDFGWWSCVDQPGGWLSALDGFLLYRVFYRRFSDHESIVCCHLADVNGQGQSGIRWYELRKTDTTSWQVYQQSTFAPDALHRVHASICMDGDGNIALGYTRSGSGPNEHPDLCIAGRKVSDSLGVMTLTETVVGNSTESNWLERMGDYSAMTLDPVSQRHFWFTGQYFADPYYWQTRITAFSILSDSNDIGPISLDAPMESPDLSSAEPVEVTVKNFGTVPQTQFAVSFRVNGGTIHTDTVSALLNPGSTHSHVFSDAADCSVDGSYDFLVYTSLVSDPIRNNDTISKTITNEPLIVLDLTAKEDFAVVYPNPQSAELYISLVAAGPEVSVRLFNSTGALVFDETHVLRQGYVNTLTVDPGQLAPGMYYLVLASAGQEQIVRLARL